MKKNISFFLAFLALLAGAFLLGRCSTKKERSQNLANLAASRDSISAYQIVVNDLTLQVSEKNAIILSKDDAIRAGVLEIKRLKELHFKEVVSNAELNAVIKILRDSLSLPPEVKFVTVKDTSGSYLAVKVPYQYDYSDQWVKLYTGIRLNRTAYFAIEVPVTGIMTIGYRRDGFLKPLKPVGIFTTDNPHLTVKSMDILIVREEMKFFERPVVHFGEGVLAGIIAIKLLK